METEKQIRFHKIAAARTNKVINDIRILSNCANRNNYSYTSEEAAQILRAIDEAVKGLKIAFGCANAPTKPFSFKK